MNFFYLKIYIKFYINFLTNCILVIMPKNLKGGKGAKKGKNSALREERVLERATDGQYYGVCTKYYGNHRGDVVFIMKSNEGKDDNNKEIIVEKEISAMGIVRGSIRKRTRLRAGNVVIVAPRDYQLDKVDIIYMYSYEDFKKLKRVETLHPNILSNFNTFNDKSSSNDAEEGVQFEQIDSDDEEELVSKPVRKKESYASIYAGMPSLSDEDDEDDEDDELANI